MQGHAARPLFCSEDQGLDSTDEDFVGFCPERDMPGLDTCGEAFPTCPKRWLSQRHPQGLFRLDQEAGRTSCNAQQSSECCAVLGLAVLGR